MNNAVDDGGPRKSEVAPVTSRVMSNDSIENLSHEDRSFAPPAEFSAQANAHADLYELAAKDPIAFWEEQARELTWEKNWEKMPIN